MRKIFMTLIIISLILPIFPSVKSEASSSIRIAYNGSTYTYKNKQVKVTVDGKKININNTPGIIVNGISLTAYKEVFKNSSIKATCTYDSTTKKITIKKGSNKIKMTLNSKTAYVNGNKVKLSVAPMKVKYKDTGVSRIVVPTRFVAENLGYKYTWNSNASTGTIEKVLNIKYEGKSYVYTGKQSKVIVNGENVKISGIPGIAINNAVLVRAKKIFKNSGIDAKYSYSSKTKVLTISKDETVITFTMGSKTAYVNDKAYTMETQAQVVTNKDSGKNYIMVPVKFTAEKLGYDYYWDEAMLTSVITEKNITAQENSRDDHNNTEQNFEEDIYNEAVEPIEELKAVWISYLEFGASAKNKQQFISMIDNMFDNCVNYGMNAVVVQVRPFSDAMYNSDYFPWSKYVSGTQGKSPGYDPLFYMVEAAHDRGLEIHAWLNPYRVTGALTDTGLTQSQMITKHLNNLSDDNPAKKWLKSNSSKDNRNVLLYDKALYYNPASLKTQELIINGIKEIVNNYNIDGIHFDDYFYPSLGTSASTAFDYVEYNSYVNECKESQKTAKSIANWRRDNVSNLIKNTYKAIKDIDSSVEFGISPAGNLSNLRSNTSYFVDIDKWFSNSGYIDYVCPQIYWGFNHKTMPYASVTDEWISLKNKGDVKLYIGIPVYKAGSETDVQSGVSEWTKNNNVLARQVEYGRSTNSVEGFMFYRLDSFNATAAKTEISNLIKVIFEVKK